MLYLYGYGYGCGYGQYYKIMNLTLDIGNTRIKTAIFDKNELQEQAFFKVVSLDVLKDFIQLNEKRAAKHVQAVIVSSTAQHLTATEGGAKVFDFLRNSFFFIELSHQTPIPIQNNYQTPQTLGRDRLAGVIGANALFPSENCLVVDAGTCITYDFITSKGVFLGGNISAGLAMRLRAMHQFTAKLPLLTLDNQDFIQTNDWIGKDTTSAMLTGAQVGFLAEVEGFIKRYENAFGQVRVLLAGGDAAFLHRHLGEEKTQLTPNLVLLGLNQILNFNL